MNSWHEKGKVECRECEWKGHINDALEAQHPFEKETTCLGCPRCKSVNSFMGLCFWPGCYKRATCGINSGFWYGEHYDQILNEKEEQ